MSAHSYRPPAPRPVYDTDPEQAAMLRADAEAPDVEGDIGWTGAYRVGDQWAAAISLTGTRWERPSNILHDTADAAIAEAEQIMADEYGPQYPTESDLL